MYVFLHKNILSLKVLFKPLKIVFNWNFGSLGNFKPVLTAYGKTTNFVQKQPNNAINSASCVKMMLAKLCLFILLFIPLEYIGTKYTPFILINIVVHIQLKYLNVCNCLLFFEIKIILLKGIPNIS